MTEKERQEESINLLKGLIEIQDENLEEIREKRAKLDIYEKYVSGVKDKYFALIEEQLRKSAVKEQ